MDTATNPIYERLTRGRRWQSGRTSMLLRVGIVLGGVILALLPKLIFNLWILDSTPALFLFGLAVAVSILSAFVGLALAGGLVNRVVTTEGLALLRLTNFPADKIESGCVAGVSDQLGLVRAIGQWALPCGLVGCACVTGGLVADTGCFGPPPLSMAYAPQGFPLALVAIAAGMLAFQVLWRWSIRIGVWLALRFGERAQSAGGTLAAFGVGLTGLFVLAAAQFGENQLLIVRVLMLLAALAVPIAVIGVQSRIAHEESIWIIEGPDDAESDEFSPD